MTQGGRTLRINGDWIEHYFTKDKFGALHPRKDALRTREVAARVRDCLEGNETLGPLMDRKEFNTDVEFPTRRLGSTPVIAFGIPEFGPSPLNKLPFRGKIGVGEVGSRENATYVARCDKRERRIQAYVEDAIATVDAIQPKDEAERVLKEIEAEQVMTGGGYDNTETFGISASLFHQLSGAVPEISEGTEQMSEILMSEIMSFRERFWSQLGNPVGTLRISGFDKVRLFQESDGMIGYPVFAKSSKELNREIARRMSIWSGVDVRWLVGTDVTGLDGVVRKAQVVDAMCLILDALVTFCDDPVTASIIWTLARIQRHGYKKGEDGKLVAKDGKSRSVSPNAALSGGPEAMTFKSLLDLMKEREIPWMPSLQDRETADRLIWDWYEKVLVPKDMRPLPLDWSKWDHHIYGWVLATILYYVVRPLYHFDDQKWVDFSIVSLVFKYFFVSGAATQALPDEWQKVLSVNQGNVVPIEGYDWFLVGTYDYLGSGAKLTHVGGSLYGELLIHHCMPRILGYEGVDGPQAGDDTAVAVPQSMIHLDSKEATFDPIVKAAAIFGLEMNTGKQIWAVGAGEVTNIFLQYAYNYNLGIKGVGTAARYYVALPFAEREKGLTIGEQYMAIISKMQNGYNNPWIRVWVRKWLERDKYACALFHYKKQQGFDLLVESIGSSLKDVSERLELTYNWGLKPEQLETGDIPILDIIVEVASEMSPTVSLEESISRLDMQQSTQKASDDIIEDIEAEDDSE